jgi:hypothetical protein
MKAFCQKEFVQEFLKMMKKILTMLVMCLAAVAMAEYTIELQDDMKIRLGGDIRARYEGYTFNVAAPDVDKDGRHSTEYFRIRTRLWGAFDFGEDVTFNLRLANRFHYVTTSPNRDNNNGKSTWEFPDEVYVDTANVEIRNLLDGLLTIKLGRQDLGFGNGMLFAEGTPFDQGRSVFTDGITLKFKTENDTVTIFTLYDEWKDRTVFINDRNRRLRSANIFTQGVYWTHKFDPTFNVDVYYMFNDVDDKQPESAERAHFADTSTSLHTAGLRFFGKYSIVDYSLEGAHQFGRGAYGEHLDADMIDARLNIHLYDDSDFKPILGFNYTHFSGDDPGTGRLEGWNPLMTQCPLWGEELMPIMLNGMWSNLESLRTFVSFNVINDLKFTLSATDYLADEKNSAVAGMAPTGGGDHVGLLLSAIASYKIMDNMSVLGYVSHFMAGDYFANGHDSYWFRLELNVAF